jgi:hypothetical protein
MSSSEQDPLLPGTVNNSDYNNQDNYAALEDAPQTAPQDRIDPMDLSEASSDPDNNPNNQDIQEPLPIGAAFSALDSGYIRIFRFIWNIAELAALIPLTFSTTKLCTDPARMYIWLGCYFVSSFGFLISLGFNWAAYRPAVYRFFKQLSSIFGIFVVITTISTLSTAKNYDQCYSNNKAFYITTLSFTSVNLLAALLPICLLLLFICCFPCAIYLLRSLIPKEEFPLTEAELGLLQTFTYSADSYHSPGEGIPDSQSYHKAELDAILEQSRTHSTVRPPINNSYLQDEPQCAICLTEYEAGETLKRFRCRHDFHSECIDNWLKQKGICPSCRKGVVERDNDGNMILPEAQTHQDYVGINIQPGGEVAQRYVPPLQD